MTLNEFYTTVGGNYEDVIARLHSEAFTEKFLRMIPQDNSLMLLKEAASAGRCPNGLPGGAYPKGHCPQFGAYRAGRRLRHHDRSSAQPGYPPGTDRCPAPGSGPGIPKSV